MLEGNSIVISTLAMNVVLGTIFILSILLCTRRRDTGFKILPIGTGLIFLNSFYYWIGGYFFAQLTHYLVFLGFVTIAISFYLILIAHGQGDPNQQQAEQGGDGDAEEAV